jgi:hypothetical protein
MGVKEEKGTIRFDSIERKDRRIRRKGNFYISPQESQTVEPHEMVVKLVQTTKIKLNPRGLHYLMWFYL